MGKNPEIYSDLYDLGIVPRKPLGKDELEEVSKLPLNELPDDIYCTFTDDSATKPEKRSYYRYPRLTDSEIMMKLALVNTRNVGTIKGCVVFITVLIVLGLVISFFSRM